jgi:SAM-dependent methyltransferase
MAVDERYYEVARPGSLSERLMIRARDRIYADFLAACSPQPTDTILDVGVSDVLTEGANVLERLYPWRKRITACGLGEAAEFQAAFPEVRYQQVAPGAPLPFPDKSFDVATSNAVLEHVGDAGHQRRFVAEVARVARRAFISVPHRYFPVEHHTGIPVAHWTDVSFALACRLLGKDKWTDESELRMMSAARLRAVVPDRVPYRIGYTGLRLGPLSSNLFLVLG